MRILKSLLCLFYALACLAQGTQVAVTTRTAKGSALTTAEMDGNFTGLQYAANGAWQTWGRKDTTTTGLTWGYYGGTYWSGSAWAQTADGTVALTASSTNYVERTALGVVSANTSGFSVGSYPMAKVITGTASILSWTDWRFPSLGPLSSPGAIGGTTPAAGAFTTLTATGTTSIGTSGLAGSITLGLFNAAGNIAGLNYYSGSTIRWAIRKGLTAESGSDAGSPLEVVAVGDGGITIDTAVSLTRAAGGTFSTTRPFKTTSTTDSTSTTTGSLQTSGGAAVTKALWVGGLANVAGVLTAANTTDASSTSTGGLVTSGGFGVAKQSYFGDQIHAAASTTTRASLSIPSGTAPSAPVSGDLWHDSTQKTLQVYEAGGIKQSLQGVIFSQTADKTFNTTAAETSMVGTGVGTVTLPANFWAPGKTVRLTGMGYLADTGTPTFTLKVKIGSVVVFNSGAITMPTLTGNQFLYIKAVLTCRTTGATGTVFCTIEAYCNNGATAVQSFNGTVNTATSTVDTTASAALDVTGTWGTANASNAATTNTFTVEVLN